MWGAAVCIVLALVGFRPFEVFRVLVNGCERNTIGSPSIMHEEVPCRGPISECDGSGRKFDWESNGIVDLSRSGRTASDATFTGTIWKAPTVVYKHPAGHSVSVLVRDCEWSRKHVLTGCRREMSSLSARARWPCGDFLGTTWSSVGIEPGRLETACARAGFSA